MNNNIKFKKVTIYVTGANCEVFEYHKNNEFKNTKKEDIINIFKLEPLHYATNLEGYDMGIMKSFNTYNWNAPFILCGVAPEDIYNGIAIVNIHLGGDARSNYSEPYICEEPESLFSQSAFLDIELSNGETYFFYCDNDEAYFDFETFDPYCINFEDSLTIEQLNELENKNNG